MPMYSNAAANSRAHWAGTAANVDVHNELIQALIEVGIREGSTFEKLRLTNPVSVESNTNTVGWRLLGGTTTGVRQVGETLEPKRITNEKVIMKVDRSIYTQIQTDFIDDWTAPDFTAEYTAEMAEAHAKTYDELHMAALIKASGWTAPGSVATRFNPGIVRNMDWATGAPEDVIARAIYRAHGKLITNFKERSTPTSGMITLASPKMFDLLLQHPLFSQSIYQPAGVTMDSTHRMLTAMNGIRIVEVTCFPTAAVASSPMGANFNLSADDIRAGLITFDPRVTLITPVAKELHGHAVTLEHEQRTIIGMVRMFNVGTKRGDRIGVLRDKA